MEAAASGHEIIVQTFLLSVCIVAWQWVRVGAMTQIPFCLQSLSHSQFGINCAGKLDSYYKTVAVFMYVA